MTGFLFTATAGSQPPPQVANGLDSAHVFLNFSSGKNVPENPVTATAYMAAIDPGQKKVNFTDWLINAGFIKQASDWFPTGQQTYTNVPGDYGPGKINAFAHIIILNSADLGFIRNQYIRCVPDCKTKNAKVYTYLENYGSTQFTKLNADGTPDLVSGVSYTNSPEAVSIALERRSGSPASGGRIADVAFEWAPAANGSSPGTNFGQLYAYVVQPRLNNITCPAPGKAAGDQVYNSSGAPVVDELYVWPSNGGANQAFWDCKFNNRAKPTLAPTDPTRIGYLNPTPDHKLFSGDPFAPELDALGTKQMPGVCLVCHGGNIPGNLATTQNWGATGVISEFKYLPADAANSIFGANDTASPLAKDVVAIGSDMTQPGQDIELKKYNQAVALTQGASLPKSAVFLADGTIGGGNWSIGKSPSHVLQVIFGWYQGFDGDYSMSGGKVATDPATGAKVLQNIDFVPLAWRTTAESTNLYLKVVAPSCRSCHFNREPSLDLRSLAAFDKEVGNIRDYVFQPECDWLRGEIKPTNIVMPLTKVTWERFWNGIDPVTKNTRFGAASTAQNDPNSQPNLLKAHFGYTPTSYCSNH